MKLFAALAILLPLVAHAGNLNLPRYFSDNMVLQRGTSATFPNGALVWGWATGGSASDKVAVSFGGKIAFGTPNPSQGGLFTIPLGNLSPNRVGAPLTVSYGGVNATVNHVVVGDVVMCGGQSNMQFTTGMEFNGSREINNTVNYPDIYVMTVGQSARSVDGPQNDLPTVASKWARASPASVGGADWQWLSAVCWETARHLFDTALAGKGIPMGLVSNNWGGTVIQTWMSPQALTQCPNSPKLHQNFPNVASQLYYSMYQPLRWLYFSQMWWYQAENNVGEDSGGPENYGCLVQAFIKDLRTQNANLPFIFVQLGTWIANKDNTQDTAVADMRWAQLAALKLPFTGVATAADLGDPTSPYDPIHPRDKITVGQRLSWVSGVIVYKSFGHSFKGPGVLGVTQNGKTISISYISNTRFPQIVVRNVQCLVPKTPNQCKGFQALIHTLTGDKWVDCEAPALVDTSIQVACPNVGSAKVKTIRYAWSTWPLMSIYNSEDLPMLPFTMDL